MKKINKEQILEYAKILNAHTRQILTYLDIYKNLLHELRGNNIVYHSTPVLFTKMVESLEDSIEIGTSKLFEKSSEVMSICELYDLCKQNQQLFPRTRKNEDGTDTGIPYDIENTLLLAQMQFTKYNEAIVNIKKRRNKLWAHSDKKYILDPTQILSKYPVIWGDIEDLLKFSSDFTNIIIMGFTNSIYTPFFVAADACEMDVKHMVALMEKSIRLEERENGSDEI